VIQLNTAETDYKTLWNSD